MRFVRGLSAERDTRGESGAVICRQNLDPLRAEAIWKQYPGSLMLARLKSIVAPAIMAALALGSAGCSREEPADDGYGGTAMNEQVYREVLSDARRRCPPSMKETDLLRYVECLRDKNQILSAYGVRKSDLLQY